MLRKSHIDAHGDVMLPKKKTMLSHDDQNRHQFNKGKAFLCENEAFIPHRHSSSLQFSLMPRIHEYAKIMQNQTVTSDIVLSGSYLINRNSYQIIL